MAKENETTTQEGPSEEEMEASREASLSNIGNDYITSLAASKMASPAEYGTMGEGIYGSSIMKAPDQKTYEQLFLPGIGSEGGVVNKARLQATAQQIIQESLGALKVSDITKYLGVKPEGLPETLNDSYFVQLSGNEETKQLQQALYGSFLTEMVESSIGKSLSQKKKIRNGQLEEILDQFKPKEEEKPSK